jgi:hypothetical protein
VFVVLSQLRIASAIVQSTYIALLGLVALGAVSLAFDRRRDPRGWSAIPQRAAHQLFINKVRKES